MAVSETAKLIVDLSLKGNFARQMGASTKALDKFTAGESRAYKAGAQIGTGLKNAGKIAAVGIGLLTTQVAAGLDSLIQLEKAEAQTAAVLKSTGQAAGVNGKEVTRLAEKYEALNAIVGDEFIRAGENMLLTFTNIRGRAFEPALQAILDLNTAMGKGPEGMTSTAIQVGKALNDPAKGITALRKVGVAFTEAQVKKIKSLQKEGKLYEAQKIILAELNKEFGGSFAAQGNTTAGKVAKFTDAVDDLQRTLAAGLLPVVSNLAEALSDLLADPEIVQGVKDFGEGLAKVLSPANIKQGIADLRGLAKVIGPAFQTAASAIGSVIDAFGKLPPDLRNLLIGAFAVNKVTGGLVTNVAGGLASALGSALKTVIAGNVTVIGKSVTGGGLGGGGAVPGAAGKGLSALSKLFLVGEAVGLVAAVIGVQQEISGQNGVFAGEIADQTDRFIATQPNKASLQSALDGVNQGIHDIESNPLNVLVSGDALDQLKAMRTKLENQLKPSDGLGNDHRDAAKREWRAANFDKVTTAVEKVRAGIESVHEETLDQKIIAAAQARTAIETKASTDAGLIATGLAAKRAGDTTASATRISASSSASRIVGAIAANRPITSVYVNVNATTVSKSVTVVNRYGPSGGSAQKDSRYGDVIT